MLSLLYDCVGIPCPQILRDTPRGPALMAHSLPTGVHCCPRGAVPSRCGQVRNLPGLRARRGLATADQTPAESHSPSVPRTWPTSVQRVRHVQCVAPDTNDTAPTTATVGLSVPPRLSLRPVVLRSTQHNDRRPSLSH